MFINREEICNLSRVPVDIENNPCYKTVLQLINVDMDYKQTVLYEHYKSYTPKTLYDLYGVGESLKKYSFDCLFLPWIHTSPVTEYSDVYSETMLLFLLRLKKLKLSLILLEK